MNSEHPKPCKCGSRNLHPKWYSDTGEQWVHCDTCGNTSKPLIGATRKELIDQWNKEQEIPDEDRQTCTEPVKGSHKQVRRLH